MMRSWCEYRIGEVVESDVSADFYSPPSTERTWNPYEISFGILGITKKTTGFSAGREFCERVGEDTGGACGAERA